MALPRYLPRLKNSGDYEFRFEGRRYYLDASNHAAKRFLQKLARFLQRMESSPTLPILLSLREDFRAIQSARPIPGLVWCVARGDSGARRLAIWLLGRIGIWSTTSVVATSIHDRDVRVRKEAAKALRRLEAWAILREVAACEDEPIVRRIAKSAPSREFSERMTRFLDSGVENVGQPDRTGSGAKALCVNTTIGDGTPPRSRWYIGLVLEHIRWLVGRHVPRFSDKQAKPQPKP